MVLVKWFSIGFVCDSMTTSKHSSLVGSSSLYSTTEHTYNKVPTVGIFETYMQPIIPHSGYIWDFIHTTKFPTVGFVSELSCYNMLSCRSKKYFEIFGACFRLVRWKLNCYGKHCFEFEQCCVLKCLLWLGVGGNMSLYGGVGCCLWFMLCAWLSC